VKRITTADLADSLMWQIQSVIGPVNWKREYRFHPRRLWRIDIANLTLKLAVECEGAGPGGLGRHQRPAGFEKDCEKYAELAIAGWRLIRVTGKQVKNGQALNWIERALK
jgi:very-short-patch-repair endonuclease